jgi:translation initiation factor IF-1
MAGADAIEVEGKVTEALKPGLYRVTLANGHKVLGHCRRSAGEWAPGTKVILEMSPFDLSKGRIKAEKEK